jgi:nucleotide-binding universal stress UspA family protein
MLSFTVATDFEEQGDKAIVSCAFLKKSADIKVNYLFWDTVTSKIKSTHALDEKLLYDNESIPGTKLPTHIAEDYRELKKRTGENLEGLKVVESKSFNEIRSYLPKESYFVVSQSDRGAMSKLFFGSFAEKAIFKTPNNVLLIKQKITTPIRKIGICFDPNQDNEKVLDDAIEFAKTFKSSIDLIYVDSFDSRKIYKNVFLTEVDSEAEKNKYIVAEKKKTQEKFSKYKEKIEARGVTCDLDLIVTVDRAPAEDLIAHLNSNPVDILFVEPNPGFMESFRFNSTSYDLIKHVPCNFVIIKQGH